MKKLILFLTIVLSACYVEAAPPLRAVKPMRLADGTIITPSAVQTAPLAEGNCCMSPAIIGDGTYLQHTGSPRVLIVLAAFQDLAFTVNDPVKAFDQCLNGEQQEDLGNRNHLNVASVRQYFETSSRNQFSPQFDVVGPIVLPKTWQWVIVQ